MKYSIKLKKTRIKEDFEINKDNIVDIYIQDKCGKNITMQCKVIAYLNKDDMLGLGKSFIRRATGYYNRGNPMHLDPIRRNGIVQTYGIYLHPMSIAAIIGDNSDELIVKYVQDQECDDDTNAVYQFELECPNREQGIIEDFEKNDMNVACFQVFDLENNNISDQIRYVGLWFVRNSLIGFGTELIRLAHNYEEGKEIHIIPAREGIEAQQAMGVHLSPTSCELIIKCKSFEPIDKILGEYNKEHIKS
jgi:hypothetical protein